MDDTTDLKPLIEDLISQISDLETALKPLLNGPLSNTSSKLPLLDRAKLHVLLTYAIESVLFSFLRLNDVNAKEHAVFAELTRVKQYFAKIKEVESGGPGARASRIDKSAAGRFISHALAGNERFDKERAERERQAKEAGRLKAEQMGKKRKLDDEADLVNEEDNEPSITHEAKDEQEVVGDGGKRKSKRVKASDIMDENDAAKKGKKDKKDKKAKKKSLLESEVVTEADASTEVVDTPTEPAATAISPATAESKKVKKSRKPDKVPKGASEVFKSLLNDPKEKAAEEMLKKKKKKSKAGA
ncbi:hypothetical protein LTS18_007882 [Coniosporium uncinatum]|uniref:Uncharacterized protein n=1 Tax=Coniosporium uncinatum TaxID=93489 RepID=A0ACC3DX76_9PEZI|nr:hypothetical protein LTS18_007882 [Coniosporium uncinatum]